MQSFTTEENAKLLETKLVDIMEDFELKDSKTVTIDLESEANKIVMEENSLTLVTSKTHQPAIQVSTNDAKLPNWVVSPYDLGGHSPYYRSQKIFSSSSSFFFLTFSRYSLFSNTLIG